MRKRNYFIKPTMKSRGFNLRTDIVRSLRNLTGFKPREPNF